MTFGENLTSLQQRSGIKTYPLCLRADFNRGTFQLWEKSDEVNIVNKINRLCQEMNCTPNELFSYGEFDWE